MSVSTLWKLRLTALLPAMGLLAATAGAAGAQTATSEGGGSILMLLDVEGRLEVGGEVRSALSSADYVSPSDAFLEAWTLDGRTAETVTVDLITDAFDAYLFVLGPGFAETLADDDGAGGCNARLTFTFLEDGTFRVVASSAGSRQTGVYTLRVTNTPEPVEMYPCGGMNPALLRSLPTDSRSIAVGDTVTGQLNGTERTIEQGRYVQAWALEGSAGQTVSITLESDAFDAYLYLLGPGIDQPREDDDGAGDLNSRITVTFPEDGTYLVIVSALSAGDTGAFRLTVAPPEEEMEEG